jgi:SAM-dependent methyltransferase
MTNGGTTVGVNVELALDPSVAFEILVDELAAGLARLGLRFEPGAGGQIAHGQATIARVVSWEPGARILLEWPQADWQPGGPADVEIRFDSIDRGTRLTLECRHFGQGIGEASELAGWFAREVAARFLQATSPSALGDWITDRRARRPSGAEARAIYRDPLYHRPNFRVLLEALALTRDDYLLEVGCGGGALLQDALRSGCRAAAIDHSPEMVRLARETNRDAVAKGRLEVVEASADRMPFPDGTFTCAVMTGVLGFLPDPIAALKEIRRVLAGDGRLALLGSDPELRGTPAAPEPMASRLRFYEDADLERLAREAGLAEVRVERRDLEAYARAAGVPDEHLELFAGPSTRFLFARKRRGDGSRGKR